VRFEPKDSLTELFAHCASLSVNAVRQPHQPRRDALRHTDRLAAALSLDIATAGRTTKADNYLSRVTKAQILEAVREAIGEPTVRLIEHLKKADMAKEAERLLQGTGGCRSCCAPRPLRQHLCRRIKHSAPYWLAAASGST
jgi:ParB family chromosome partitioning protein